MKIKKLDLLLKEIDDPVVQENFWRIKNLFESGQLQGEPGTAAPALTATDIFLGRYFIPASETVEIPENYESVVTATQTVDGVLTVNGRNTVL